MLDVKLDDIFVGFIFRWFLSSLSDMIMPWFLLLLFFTFLESFPLNVTCAKLPDIYWNSSNPIFRIDNTDHIIDVNRNSVPYEYDQVNIICPVYPPGANEDDSEKYIIYNVSKDEYDMCTITGPNPRTIAVCDKPHRLMYFTITFRPFTPQPGGLEFRPGQDYYFISTSSKDNFFNRIGGRCLSHNMRVIFKVCCDASDKSSIPSTTTTTTVLPPVVMTNLPASPFAVPGNSHPRAHVSTIMPSWARPQTPTTPINNMIGMYNPTSPSAVIPDLKAFPGGTTEEQNRGGKSGGKRVTGKFNVVVTSSIIIIITRDIFRKIFKN
ncbi:hypothetical protein CHUAL_004577 [Chamberlinius hualienensis]